MPTCRTQRLGDFVNLMSWGVGESCFKCGLYWDVLGLGFGEKLHPAV